MRNNESIIASIIIPIYNAEKYLDECLHSIVNQTINNIEIICINDGSTDNSIEIIKKYSIQDDRIKVIDKKNEGTEVARNVGLDTAIGKYIAFLDADDYVKNTYIEKMVEAIETNYADSVQCNYKTFGYHQKRKHRLLSIKENGLYEVNKVYNDLITAALFKKEIIENNKIRIPCVRYRGDMYFKMCYLMSSNNTYLLSDVLYFYRFHENSLVSIYLESNNKARYTYEVEYVKLLKILLKFMKKSNKTIIWKDRIILHITSSLKRCTVRYGKKYVRKIFNNITRVFLASVNRELFEKNKNIYTIKNDIFELKIFKLFFVTLYSTSQYLKRKTYYLFNVIPIFRKKIK
ncbi:MAG: glycosyltransferase family 2 protein [Alphaproteobacteria bacterium]|nr:glycosyltransferase family 2 protein [Alphaproteobacteria bacterium]